VKKKRLELGNLWKEIQRLQHSLIKERQALTEETDAIGKVHIRIRKKEKEKAEILQKSAELNEVVSERTKLLGTLKAYIEGGTCPLCGHNWKSGEVLMEQVQMMSGRDEKLIAKHKTAMLGIQKEIADLLRESSERQANVKILRNRVNEAASELRRLQENEEDVKKAASEYGLSAEKLLSMEDQSVEKSLIQSKKNLNEMDVRIAALTKEVTQDFQRVSASGSEMKKMEIEKETKKKRLQDLTVFLREFEREAAETGITETELSEIGKLVAQIESEIRELTQKKEKTMEQKKNAVIKIERMDKEKDQQTEKYEALYRGLEYNQEQIRIFSSKIGRFGLKSYREASETLAALAKSEQDIRRLIEDLTKALESIDSAKARIMCENLEKEVQELKDNVHSLGREVDRIKASRKLAEKLNRAARKETRTVIESLIKAHEPLINEFYRQINPHPRFTTINFVPKGISGRGGGNAVFIEATDEYEKKVVNPALTFSSAQLNVLAISIFLAIHTNQAWSKLDTILMDDPIQNMDDLNILSYIDLIRKIRKKEQIIISTHDDNIYRLMRRKLQPSDKEQLICYEYKSFNVKGPEIKINRISAAE
jgi:DNA repair exonuclease SbcCD ATPase subunit